MHLYKVASLALSFSSSFMITGVMETTLVKKSWADEADACIPVESTESVIATVNNKTPLISCSACKRPIQNVAWWQETSYSYFVPICQGCVPTYLQKDLPTSSFPLSCCRSKCGTKKDLFLFPVHEAFRISCGKCTNRQHGVRNVQCDQPNCEATRKVNASKIGGYYVFRCEKCLGNKPSKPAPLPVKKQPQKETIGTRNIFELLSDE